jgi:hypothetical protein|tara:strand:- start:20 stop:373 length:354 start_codon:yes stop_codon:yes gene_type:complete
MFKSIIAATAAIVAGGSAFAAPVDPGFGVNTIVRGEAYAIRSCGDAYGPRVDVCYNQDTTGSIFPFSRNIGISVDRTRVVRVACDRPHAEGTTRGEVAAEFCPQVEAGTLAPAPFLS